MGEVGVVTQKIDVALDTIKPALLLKYLDDADRARQTSNYFGGEPQLPDDIAWPENPTGEPLHFIFQMDCGALPHRFNLGGHDWELPKFPTEGTFFLFANLANYDIWESSADGAKVVYSASAVAELPPRKPPETLARLGSKSLVARNAYDINFFSMKPTEITLKNHGIIGEGFPAKKQLHQKLQSRAFDALPPSQALPKLPFSALPYLTTYSTFSEHKPSAEERDLLEGYGLNALWPRRYLAATDRYFPWMENITRFRRQRKEQHISLVRERHGKDVRSLAFDVPELGFPWRWLAAGNIALEVFKWASQQIDLTEVHWPLLIDEAEEWARRASAVDPLDRITGNESNEFIDWLQTIDAVANTQSEKDERIKVMSALGSLQSQLIVSLDTSLNYLRGADDISDIPSDLVVPARLTPEETDRESIQVGGFQMNHQFLGYADRWQQDEPEDSDDMLLFQVASDCENLNIEFGILHIWIKKTDFAAGHFDRAWAHAETT